MAIAERNEARVGELEGGGFPSPFEKLDVEEAGDGDGGAEGADDHAHDHQEEPGADDLAADSPAADFAGAPAAATEGAIAFGRCATQSL